MRRILASTVAALFYAAALVVAIPPTAYAAESCPGPKAVNTYSAKVSGAAFTTLAINTAKTFDPINVCGYETVLVEFSHTYSSASHVVMTCVEGPTSTSQPFKIPETQSAGSGTIDHYQRSWRWVTGGVSGASFFEVPVRYQWLKCSFVGAGAGAGDTLSVTIRAQE